MLKARGTSYKKRSGMLVVSGTDLVSLGVLMTKRHYLPSLSNFRKFKVALNPMYRIFLTLPKVASYPAYQNSIITKNFTVPFLKYKRLKLKLKVFLAVHSVAMVTYSVTKTIPTCAPMIGQSFDTMIVKSTNKEW